MSKKIRITNSNILAEQRYLLKKFINEVDPKPVREPLPVRAPLPKNPVLSKEDFPLIDDDKAKISSVLWDKIKSNEELKSHLDLQPHHTEHNFLNDISHNIHGHITKNGHVTLEFPGLGKHHNVTLMLGKTLTQHGDSHGEHDIQPSSIPHSSFDFGVKFNLGDLFSKKHHT